MTGALELLSTFRGAYLLEGGRVVSSRASPNDATMLAERIAMRREGRSTPEESGLLAEAGAVAMVTRDRRLVGPRVRYSPTGGRPVPEPIPPSELESLRSVLLEAAERSLTESWDPSIHVEEAVRAMGDLDHTLNLVGERLASWGGRDVPEEESEGGATVAGTARRLAASLPAADDPLAPADPEVAAARQRLARLYVEVDSVRHDLESAIEGAMPRRAPNLCQLLGASLTAKLLSQAGGLARIARLPASTIQVLGAERAFFEHLRGRAPPPRHGLLFLHPDVQGAPRRLRGKLARALAGKVAIAARLDWEGTALRPELAISFTARAKAIRGGAATSGRKRRSAPPLDRAAEDR